MEREKLGKGLAIGLVLFFIILILLGGFVGKRLVDLIRTSNNQEEIVEKAPELAGLEGGYSFPTPTSYFPPINTATVQPTEGPINTATVEPTEGPINTTTVQPTEGPRNTETIPPVEQVTETPTSEITKVPQETQTATPLVTASLTPTRTVHLFGNTGTPPVASSTISPLPSQEVATQTPAPMLPPTVGPGGDPGTYLAGGMILALVGMFCFGLYFWKAFRIEK